MATAKDIRFNGYCDRMYAELSGTRDRLLGFVKEIESMPATEKKVLESHITHFQDLVKMIEWKLEILTRVCPFEWSAYSGNFERASVEVPTDVRHMEAVSGGYGGG